MDDWRARWALAVVGVASMVFAVVIRHDLLAGALLVAGVLLVLAAAFGPHVEEISFSKDGASIRNRAERDASAELAEDTSVTRFEAEIGSEDEDPPLPSTVDAKVIGGLNLAAGEIALHAIFREAQASGPLRGCSIRLYIYDADDRLLAPALSDDTSEPRWQIGQGATGTAYATGQLVIATGMQTWDNTYGLTPAQANLYRNLAAVGSVPVYNAVGAIIGVVTASTTDETSDLPTPDGELALLGVALLVSRILVELLQWFEDDR